MKLSLVYHPHTSLRRVAKPVQDFDASLHSLLKEMKKVLQQKQGLGLAAPQVDRDLQCFLVRYEETVHTFVNPKILYTSNEMGWFDEGCLSIPGVYAQVERPVGLKIRAQNEKGDFFEVESETLFARIIFHEYDHLQGKLFVDHLPQNMKKRILKEYRILQETEQEIEQETQTEQEI